MDALMLAFKDPLFPHRMYFPRRLDSLEEAIREPHCARCDEDGKQQVLRLMRFGRTADGRIAGAKFGCKSLSPSTVSYALGFEMSMTEVRAELQKIEEQAGKGKVRGSGLSGTYQEAITIMSHFVPEGEEIKFKGFCGVCFKLVPIVVEHEKVGWNDCIGLLKPRS
jgi:hypothetical protein